jgi:hypothetical protein
MEEIEERRRWRSEGESEGEGEGKRKEERREETRRRGEKRGCARQVTVMYVWLWLLWVILRLRLTSFLAEGRNGRWAMEGGSGLFWGGCCT